MSSPLVTERPSSTMSNDNKRMLSSNNQNLSTVQQPPAKRMRSEGRTHICIGCKSMLPLPDGITFFQCGKCETQQHVSPLNEKQPPKQPEPQPSPPPSNGLNPGTLMHTCVGCRSILAVPSSVTFVQCGQCQTQQHVTPPPDNQNSTAYKNGKTQQQNLNKQTSHQTQQQHHQQQHQQQQHQQQQQLHKKQMSQNRQQNRQLSSNSSLPRGTGNISRDERKTLDQLNMYTVDQLKDLLRSHRLKVSGAKAELIRRILDNISVVPSMDSNSKQTKVYHMPVSMHATQVKGDISLTIEPIDLELPCRWEKFNDDLNENIREIFDVRYQCNIVDVDQEWRKKTHRVWLRPKQRLRLVLKNHPELFKYGNNYRFNCSPECSVCKQHAECYGFEDNQLSASIWESFLEVIKCKKFDNRGRYDQVNSMLTVCRDGHIALAFPEEIKEYDALDYYLSGYLI